MTTKNESDKPKKKRKRIVKVAKPIFTSNSYFKNIKGMV